MYVGDFAMNAVQIKVMNERRRMLTKQDPFSIYENNESTLKEGSLVGIH